MMTLIAAAVAAAQPAAPAPANIHAQHQMQPGKPAEHKGMDCCKDCCKDMAKKEHGERAGHHESHAGHSSAN